MWSTTWRPFCLGLDVLIDLICLSMYEKQFDNVTCSIAVEDNIVLRQ